MACAVWSPDSGSGCSPRRCRSCSRCPRHCPVSPRVGPLVLQILQTSRALASPQGGPKCPAGLPRLPPASPLPSPDTSHRYLTGSLGAAPQGRSLVLPSTGAHRQQGELRGRGRAGAGAGAPGWSAALGDSLHLRAAVTWRGSTTPTLQHLLGPTALSKPTVGNPLEEKSLAIFFFFL